MTRTELYLFPHLHYTGCICQYVNVFMLVVLVDLSTWFKQWLHEEVQKGRHSDLKKMNSSSESENYEKSTFFIWYAFQRTRHKKIPPQEEVRWFSEEIWSFDNHTQIKQTKEQEVTNTAESTLLFKYPNTIVYYQNSCENKAARNLKRHLGLLITNCKADFVVCLF